MLKVCNPAQVIAISTDGASAYTGCHKGAFELLKQDPDFNSGMQFLWDIPHKLERLMLKAEVNKQWVIDTIEESKILANAIEECEGLKFYIKSKIVSNESNGFKWHEIQKHSKTRFSTNVHHHFTPLMKDIPIMLHCIPLYLQETDIDSVTRNTIEGILKKNYRC